jgi:hypothetical protein
MHPDFFKNSVACVCELIITTAALPAKLVPTFSYRECHVVSVMDPYSAF